MEAGRAIWRPGWQLESAINEKTAALLYVKSHHCVQKGMLSIDDFAWWRRYKPHLPLIVDAAAEEDLRGWVASGADMVIYSGAKFLRQPGLSLVETWIAACKAQRTVGLPGAMKNRQGKHGWAGVCAGEFTTCGQTIRLQHKVTAGRGSDFRHPWTFYADIEQDEAGRNLAYSVCG